MPPPSQLLTHVQQNGLGGVAGLLLRCGLCDEITHQAPEGGSVGVALGEVKGARACRQEGQEGGQEGQGRRAGRQTGSAVLLPLRIGTSQAASQLPLPRQQRAVRLAPRQQQVSGPDTTTAAATRHACHCCYHCWGPLPAWIAAWLAGSPSVVPAAKANPMAGLQVVPAWVKLEAATRMPRMSRKAWRKSTGPPSSSSPAGSTCSTGRVWSRRALNNG